MVALTFDDGPNPPYTQEILDELAAEHARATFFVEGEASAQSRAVVGREVEMGMAVGSHSARHMRDYPSERRDQFEADLDAADQEIEGATGYHPRLYRAPYGRWSGTMLRALRERGYTPVGWDVDSRDWDPATPADAIARNVVAGAHPGAIVLLHDGGLGGGEPDRERTVRALPEIIRGLRARGYRLVTVPEITGMAEAGGRATEPC